MTHSTGTLYIISAPSGAGKSSLVKALTDANRKSAFRSLTPPAPCVPVKWTA
jgi:guanylate kinase